MRDSSEEDLDEKQPAGNRIPVSYKLA